jgi:hypothetical protein
MIQLVSDNIQRHSDGNSFPFYVFTSVSFSATLFHNPAAVSFLRLMLLGPCPQPNLLLCLVIRCIDINYLR